MVRCGFSWVSGNTTSVVINTTSGMLQVDPASPSPVWTKLNRAGRMQLTRPKALIQQPRVRTAKLGWENNNYNLIMIKMSSGITGSSVPNRMNGGCLMIILKIDFKINLRPRKRVPFLSVPVRYGEHSRLACHTKLTYGLSTHRKHARLSAGTILLRGQRLLSSSRNRQKSRKSGRVAARSRTGSLEESMVSCQEGINPNKNHNCSEKKRF